MPPRRKLSPEEVEAMMVPELVKAIYPVLIPMEQQCVQIQQRNHALMTEIATAIWRQFSQAMPREMRADQHGDEND